MERQRLNRSRLLEDDLDNEVGNARNSQSGRDPVHSVSIHNRSAVTNGTKLLIGIDGRLPWARRFRDLIDLYMADCGGQHAMTEGRKALVRRAATLQLELERMDVAFAEMAEAGDSPGEMRLATYASLAGHLRRLIESLGLMEDRPGTQPPVLNHNDFEQNTAKVMQYIGGKR